MICSTVSRTQHDRYNVHLYLAQVKIYDINVVVVRAILGIGSLLMICSAICLSVCLSVGQVRESYTNWLN